MALGHAVAQAPELSDARFRTNLQHSSSESVAVEVEDAEATRIADALAALAQARPAAYFGPVSAKELVAAWASGVTREISQAKKDEA